MSFIQWIECNEQWISLCIAILSLLVNTILTGFIIWQTKRLNQNQQELEKSISNQQIELQKRQIQIDSYPYKREIYTNVFQVLALCDQLKNITETVDLNDLSPEQIFEVFSLLQEQYVPDRKQTLWILREAEYVLSSQIAHVVLDIRDNYDTMCTHFIVINTFSKLDAEFVNGYAKELTKSYNIEKIVECCNKIVNHTTYIENVFPTELNISLRSK